MNIAAYVIAFLATLFLKSEYIGVQIGPLHMLSGVIKKHQELPKNAFKDSQYIRTEHKGFIITSNLKEYYNKGIGDLNEEGMIVTLDFQAASGGNNDPNPFVYILHDYDFNEKDMKLLDQYIQRTFGKTS